MTDPIRIAVVGLGKIAHDQHLPAIAKDGRFQLAATVSQDGRHHATLPCFSTMEQLAASNVEIDAVALCTPPQVRRALAHFAIDQGWHVFLEKPPAATLTEAAMLRDHAAERGISLFASWHSRHAAQVETARAWLSERPLTQMSIVWAEDVRQWHPGQDWIFEPGGFGVFDPAINALSIVTHILSRRVYVESAQIDVPANRDAAIAAEVVFRDAAGLAISASFDFLRQGEQRWDIIAVGAGETLSLTNGGATMAIEGERTAPAPASLIGEYPALYRRFAAIIDARGSDVDLAPLRLVADILMKARVRIVAPFDW